MRAVVALAVLAAAPAARADDAPGSASPGPTIAQAQPAPTTAQVLRALRRYAHEPTVDRVVRAVLAASASSPAGASDLGPRARTAGWVPRVGLTARRGQAVDLSDSLDDERIRLSTDDDLTLTASLTFELDRVVFRPEEVAIAREVRAREGDRAARIRETVDLYFRRRRLQLERDLGLTDPLECTLRIAEIEALLDALSKGAFKRMIAR